MRSQRALFTAVITSSLALASLVIAQAGPPGDGPPPPPPPRGDHDHGGDHGDPNHGPAAPVEVDESKLAKGTVVVHGGYDTDPRDHGRPVVLVAAGLGVPTDVFRTAFSGVHPAGPNSGGPTDSEARANKAALMKVLGPYGVTDQRLNEVSNYYRYVRSRGEIWKSRPAKITAVIDGDQVTGFTIDDPGAGYTTPPTLTVAGYPGAAGETTIDFETDLTKNGGIKTATLK